MLAQKRVASGNSAGLNEFRESQGGPMKRAFKFISLLCLAFPAIAPAQKGKPIVAIYQMDDLANTGQAQTFSTMIETAIAATSKFRVIERERLGKLLGEQTKARAGLVTTNRPGKLGGFEGADYLIYGSITTVSVQNKTDIGSSLLGGFLSGAGNRDVHCANTHVTLGVDIKITDADSGEVKYVTRINELQKNAAICGGGTSVNVSALMRSAADKVATALVTTIYPIQIASVQGDGVVILNYGEGAVQLGATMAVYSKGRSIVDPATGETIGNDEIKLGLVRVSEIMGRISKADPMTAFVNAPPVGSIVRVATAADLAALSKNKKRK